MNPKTGTKERNKGKQKNKKENVDILHFLCTTTQLCIHVQLPKEIVHPGIELIGLMKLNR